MASGSSEAKVAAIVGGTGSIWSGTVLDIGCRTREVERAFVDGAPVRYVGVDLADSGDVVADLGDRLPFVDNSVDVVVALDVLEHTDGIHGAFAELCRVARRNIVISLPNEFDVKQRWLTARGRHTGKWGLPTDAPRDRHRWRFTLAEAQEFCGHSASINGWRVDAEYALIGPARNRAIGRALVDRWPGLFVPTYVALLSSEKPAISA